MANTFRWLDHIQHLPGMLEQVEALGVLTAFPDLTQQEPSKAQLKKLEKIQAAKLKKEQKKAGQEQKGGAEKGGEKKEKQQQKGGD